MDYWHESFCNPNTTASCSIAVSYWQPAEEKGSRGAGEKGSRGAGEPQDQTGTLFVVQDIEGKTKVSARAVTFGKKANGQVEILSGLQPGERYVVRSGKPLKEGDAVRLSIISETARVNP